MDLLALLLLVIVALVAYPYLQDWRENAIARRLERTRDPESAAKEVDRAIAALKSEADTLNRFRGGHRW